MSKKDKELSTEIDMSKLSRVSNGAEAKTSTVMPYVTFSGKTGEWTYGFEQDPLSHTREILVGGKTFTLGFIGWENGAVVGEVMVSVFSDEPMPELKDLEPKLANEGMNGWSEQKAVNFVIDGKAHVFKGTAYGAKDMINQLSAAVLAQHAVHPQACNPIITVGEDHYTHKKFGSVIYSPTFKIVGWAGDDGVPAAKALAA